MRSLLCHCVCVHFCVTEYAFTSVWLCMRSLLCDCMRSLLCHCVCVHFCLTVYAFTSVWLCTRSLLCDCVCVHFCVTVYAFTSVWHDRFPAATVALFQRCSAFTPLGNCGFNPNEHFGDTQIMQSMWYVVHPLLSAVAVLLQHLSARWLLSNRTLIGPTRPVNAHCKWPYVWYSLLKMLYTHLKYLYMHGLGQLYALTQTSKQANPTTQIARLLWYTYA